MIGVALVSGCSTTSVNETENEIIVETRPTNVLPTNDNKQDNQTQNDSTFYEHSESPTAEASESLGVPSPESSPTPPPTVSQSLPEATEEPAVVYDTVSFVDSVEQCKIPELFLETDPPMPSKGFPLAGNRVPYRGIVNIDVIFLDFPNVPAKDSSIINSYEQSMKNATEWSKFYSGGEMLYNIKMHKEWLRAPKNAEEYPKRSHSEEYAKVQDWVTVADPYYDFSETHFLFFIVPEGAHFVHRADMYGPSKSFTDEGILEVPVWTSEFEPSLSWQHLVHEILHDQGIGGHGPANGSSYGMMMGQWYGSYSLISWNTFLMGWTPNEDIVCIDARDGFDEVAIRLNSLDRLGASPGIKSIIVRQSNTAATVIEYRTDGRFSPIDKSLHGVTVYNLDVAKKWHRCDQCGPQQYEDEKNWWNYIRKPYFHGHNNNFNFGNGVIPNTKNMTIEVVDQNLILLSE